MRAALSLFIITIVPALGLSAESADLVRLKDDYQVLQRDSADEGGCAVVLPAELRIAGGVTITVEDARVRGFGMLMLLRWIWEMARGGW